MIFLRCLHLLVKVHMDYIVIMGKRVIRIARLENSDRLASPPANALSPFRRRGALPPFEFALMFSIKSKRHSDGGRCARNPNRGHKLPKGSARIAAKCLSPRHYTAVARETVNGPCNLESKFFPSIQRTISDMNVLT